MIFAGTPQFMKGENEMGIKSFILGVGIGAIAGTAAPVVGVAHLVKKNKTVMQDILLEAMGFDHNMVRRSQVRYSSYGRRYKTYNEITFRYLDEKEAKLAYMEIMDTINYYGYIRIYDIEHSIYLPSFSMNKINTEFFGWTDIHDFTLVGNRIKALPPVSLKEVTSNEKN